MKLSLVFLCLSILVALSHGRAAKGYKVKGDKVKVSSHEKDDHKHWIGNNGTRLRKKNHLLPSRF